MVKGPRTRNSLVPSTHQVSAKVQGVGYQIWLRWGPHPQKTPVHREGKKGGKEREELNGQAVDWKKTHKGFWNSFLSTENHSHTLHTFKGSSNSVSFSIVVVIRQETGESNVQEPFQILFIHLFNKLISGAHFVPSTVLKPGAYRREIRQTNPKLLLEPPDHN